MDKFIILNIISFVSNPIDFINISIAFNLDQSFINSEIDRLVLQKYHKKHHNISSLQKLYNLYSPIEKFVIVHEYQTYYGSMKEILNIITNISYDRVRKFMLNDITRNIPSNNTSYGKSRDDVMNYYKDKIESQLEILRKNKDSTIFDNGIIHYEDLYDMPFYEKPKYYIKSTDDIKKDMKTTNEKSIKPFIRKYNTY